MRTIKGPRGESSSADGALVATAPGPRDIEHAIPWGPQNRVKMGGPVAMAPILSGCMDRAPVTARSPERAETAAWTMGQR